MSTLITIKKECYTNTCLNVMKIVFWIIKLLIITCLHFDNTNYKNSFNCSVSAYSLHNARWGIMELET